MPTQKLTETLLKTVDRPESGTARYWDSEIKGFVAHVQKTTTTLYYDRDNRRHLIGKFPSVRLDRAREAVRDLDFRLRLG
jgi:predicted Mrr-cat superfamily restriction endonuclease